MTKPMLLVWLGALLMAAAPALASDGLDPFELEAGATGATLRSQPLSEVPASVTVISREDLRDFAVSTLADALSMVRGVFVSSDHNYHYAGLRGYGPLGDWGTHLLVMIDGHPLIGGFYLDTPLGSDFPVDMSAVERIEVVRGPGSALFGTNALLGVINVVTRRAAAGMAIEGRVSTAEERCAIGEAGGRFGSDWSWYASLTGFGGEGPDYPLGTTAVAGADGDRGRRGFASIDGRAWSFQALAGTRTREVPTGAWETEPGDDRTRTRDSWALASAEYFRPIGASSALLARVSMSRDHYEGDYFSRDPESGNPAPLSRDESTGRSAELDARLLLQPFDRLGLTVGAARREDFTAEARSWYAEPYELLSDTSRPWHRQSTYMQADWTPSTAVSVQGGLRAEDASPGPGVVNPRLGVNWRPHRDWTVRGLAGRAYRRPNLYETYYSDGSTSKGNPDLAPERLTTWEAGLESRQAGVTATLSVFQNDFNDRIVAGRDPVDSLIVYQNAGALRVRGLEMELSGAAFERIRWRASWTWASHDDADEAGQVNFARHVGQAAAVVPVPAARGRVAVLFRAVGSRRGALGGRVPGYGITDLVLSGEPLPGRLEAALRIRNVLDQSWNDPGGEEQVTDALPGAGRSGEIRLKVLFGGP
jgi:outer membrane receptor protein involved in Fe transport